MMGGPMVRGFNPVVVVLALIVGSWALVLGAVVVLWRLLHGA